MKPHILYDLKWEIKIKRGTLYQKKKRGTKRISPHYINQPGLTQINNLILWTRTLYSAKRGRINIFFGEKKH